MAESLRRLNQARDSISRADANQCEQPSATAAEGPRPEIYHSLEDAVPISDASPTSATPVSVQHPPRAFEALVTPVAGQICR